jgi:hypothetical protein
MYPKDAELASIISQKSKSILGEGKYERGGNSLHNWFEFVTRTSYWHELQTRSSLSERGEPFTLFG